jgi:hypothetical protein
VTRSSIIAALDEVMRSSLLGSGLAPYYFQTAVAIRRHCGNAQIRTNLCVVVSDAIPILYLSAIYSSQM